MYYIGWLGNTVYNVPIPWATLCTCTLHGQHYVPVHWATLRALATLGTCIVHRVHIVCQFTVVNCV